MSNLPSYGPIMARIAENYISTVISFLRPYGLDRYYNAVLFISDNSGKITQKDLADQFLRDKVFVMRMVDHLCEKGMVVRKTHENDRRCQLLIATKKAQELVPHIHFAINKTNDIFFAKFSVEERKNFARSVEKIIQVVDHLPTSDFEVVVEPKSKD